MAKITAPMHGDIYQICYIVEDLDAAMDHWINVLGVGPFYELTVPLPITWLKRDGVAVTDGEGVWRRMAIAQSGPVQIELIVPGPSPSTYREFIDSGRTGVHHVAILTDDFEAQMAAVHAANVGVAMEGQLALCRFAYLRTDIAFPGAMVEIVEATQPVLDLNALVIDAAKNWDGSDPIRKL